MNSPDPNDYEVSVGIHDLLKPFKWSKINLKINKIVKHPDYNKNRYQNDIALAKLSVNIVFKDPCDKIVFFTQIIKSSLSFDDEYNIFPVCIATEFSGFDFSKNAYATGWGKL